MSKLISGIKVLFERCLSEPSVNSRLVFFAHGAVSAVGIAVLIGFFIHASPENKASYPAMVMAVGGTGGVAALGRFLTKKGDAAPPDPAVSPDPAPLTPAAQG